MSEQRGLPDSGTGEHPRIVPIPLVGPDGHSFVPRVPEQQRVRTSEEIGEALADIHARATNVWTSLREMRDAVWQNPNPYPTDSQQEHKEQQ